MQVPLKISKAGLTTLFTHPHPHPAGHTRALGLGLAPIRTFMAIFVAQWIRLRWDLSPEDFDESNDEVGDYRSDSRCEGRLAHTFCILSKRPNIQPMNPTLTLGLCKDGWK